MQSVPRVYILESAWDDWMKVELLGRMSRQSRSSQDDLTFTVNIDLADEVVVWSSGLVSTDIGLARLHLICNSFCLPSTSSCLIIHDLNSPLLLPRNELSLINSISMASDSEPYRGPLDGLDDVSAQLIKDRNLAESISRAVNEDADMIDILMEEEDR